MNKTVLITGGAGFIGTHLIDKLLQRDYKVYIIDQFIFGEDPIASFLTNKNFHLIKGKIEDSPVLSEVLKKIDVVVHLAGLVGDPACAVNEDLTMDMNVNSTKIIKELSKEAKVGRFIFASSCSVYGASDETMDEDSPVNPMSLYAQTKVVSEKDLISDYSDDFHPVILRFGTVYGHSKRPRFDLVGNLFIAQAYIDGVIKITGRNQWRLFVHVSDVANAIVKSIEAPLLKVDREIFNVGDDSQSITIDRLAYLVADIVKESKSKKKVKIIIKDDISDKRNYKVSCKKIREILDFHASVTLQEGLKEVYLNFINNIYKHNYKDAIYSNVETIKLLQGGNIKN